MHKVGLIGCGWFAPFHLDALAQLRDRATVAWCADVDVDKARDVAVLASQQTGADVDAITDYRDGLDAVDCVHILLPHHLHAPVTIDCLDAGKHVLLEKPMANTLDEVDAMIAAADRAQRTLMIAYPHRYRESMQRFRQLVTNGSHGNLFMLDGMMDEALVDYVGGWLKEKRTLGGGVFFSSSPHMLDVMLWIAGDVQAVSMAGTRAAADMEGEDTACSVIRFTSGAVGVTRHTWASPVSRVWYTMHAVCERAHVTLTTTPTGDLFSQGASCPWETRIVVDDVNGSHVALESDEGLNLAPEVSHFLDCVDTGTTPQTDGRTARKIIALVHEAYADAAARGANV